MESYDRDEVFMMYFTDSVVPVGSTSFYIGVQLADTSEALFAISTGQEDGRRVPMTLIGMCDICVE